jgi:phenylalanyl-tRNA synthetase beta chain
LHKQILATFKAFFYKFLQTLISSYPTETTFMKCSESWLREWVNPALTREELCTSLTMAGLEVDELAAVAKNLKHVVVAEVLSIEKHPEADKLTLCQINIGETSPLQIVCGAPNVRAGLKVPLAKIGAILPNDFEIKPASIRGVASQGMLCSAKELGLSEDNQGLWELPTDAPIGQEIQTYLKLDDYVIDISITPNRGDCLSIRGLAREISALTQTPLKAQDIPHVKPSSDTSWKVLVQAKQECPVYLGRVVKNIKADAATPTYIKERLRRSGIRSISPVVDVTNYVMLELGQPMHAFDLDTLEKEIQVRKSKSGEKITLLDGSEKELDAETLVIADAVKPLAIAGVMGGSDSSVTLLTKNIFLESAFFTPQIVARQRQYYNLSSDSAYRFERGVDPTIQREALERASQLILEIAGGEASAIIEVKAEDLLPKQNIICLAQTKIAKILGLAIPDNEVETIFKSLGFSFERSPGFSLAEGEKAWTVEVPSYRFDISLPEDLIEEIARVHGYDKIPTHTLKSELQTQHANEGAKDFQALRQCLSDAAYHEIISYSFVDPKLQKLLDPSQTPCELVNPITAEMAVMRTNLWAGLVNTLLYNKSRQQNRVRLFEMGTCFIQQEDGLSQLPRLGGLTAGLAHPEQWGMPGREVDFYDVKGDLQKLFHFLNTDKQDQLVFKPETHAALHPGQTAGIYYQDIKIGILGALHPMVLQALDISGGIFVYELDISSINSPDFYHSQEISKFPEIRRDLAILVNQAIPASDIQDTIKVIAGDWLKDVFIFDVYQGKGISPGLKSIALGLVLQHPTRTLVDDEVTALMESVVTTLQDKLGAELRR